MEYGAKLGLALLAIIILLAAWGVWDFITWKRDKQTFTQWVAKRAIWIAWVLSIGCMTLGAWLFFHWDLLG